jgi:hypothetical protein
MIASDIGVPPPHHSCYLLTQPRDVEPAIERLVDLAFTVYEPLKLPPSPAQDLGLN